MRLQRGPKASERGFKRTISADPARERAHLKCKRLRFYSKLEQAK
jgi:hypothetical protein